MQYIKMCVGSSDTPALADFIMSLNLAKFIMSLKVKMG